MKECEDFGLLFINERTSRSNKEKPFNSRKEKILFPILIGHSIVLRVSKYFFQCKVMDVLHKRTQIPT